LELRHDVEEPADDVDEEDAVDEVDEESGEVVMTKSNLP
jgi:hypothetical protein